MSSKDKDRINPDTQTEQPLKLIKRYTNRKMYDTRESRYVTLEEIAEMVRNGEDLKIVDNRTKSDITSITLAQIIYEQEKKMSRMPLSLLRNIVRHGGESVQVFFEREIQPRMSFIREGAEHKLEKMFRRERNEIYEKNDEEEKNILAENITKVQIPENESVSAPEKESLALLKMMQDLRESLEVWQKCFDLRIQNTVRDAARLPARAMKASGLRKSLFVLRSRLEELDSKLSELEEKD